MRTTLAEQNLERTRQGRSCVSPRPHGQFGGVTDSEHDLILGLVDIDAVARMLGVNVRHVRRLVAERRIPYIKWGRLIRFDIAELERWVDARRVCPEGRDIVRTSDPVDEGSRQDARPSGRGVLRRPLSVVR